MKIFLSWSGDSSKAVADTLQRWLQDVIPTIDPPWISDQDIEAGDRWASTLKEVLGEPAFGIICLTKANLFAPWLHFEAGALSRSEGARLCPYLFGCSPDQVPGPLKQFQSKLANEEGTWELVRSINDVLKERSLEVDRLRRSFDLHWEALSAQLGKIKDVGQGERMLGQLAEDVKIISMEDFKEKEALLGPGDKAFLFSNSLFYDLRYFVNVIAGNLNEGVEYRYLMADDKATKRHWKRLLNALAAAGASRMPKGRFTQVAPMIWTTAIYEYDNPKKGIAAISILEYRFETNACVEVSAPIAEEMWDRFLEFWNLAEENSA